jgi:thiol-disulfide isomerase/thioredoxin
MRGLAAAVLLLVLASCARREEITNLGCVRPPEIEAAWRAHQGIAEACGRDASCWRRAVEDARNLRDAHSKEFFAHRAFVNQVLWASQTLPEGETLRRQLEKEYERLAADHPENPAYPYLLARIAESAEKRRQHLASVISLDPGFPWAHQAWIRELAYRPTDDDRRRMVEHFEAFVRLCPDPVEALALLDAVGEAGAWQRHATELRSAITPSGKQFEELPDLWALEFRFAPPSEHGAIRERVRADVAEVEREGPRTSARLAVLRKGYALAGEPAQARAAEDEWLERFPCRSDSTRIRMERRAEEMRTAGPDGSRSASPVARWLEECPDDMVLWQARLDELIAQDDAPVTEVEAASDRVTVLAGPAASPRVAEAYLDKGIRLERVPRLIERAEEESERSWNRAQNQYSDSRLRTMWAGQRAHERFIHQALRTRLALAQKDVEGAGLALAELDLLFDAIREITEPPFDQAVPWQEARLWRLRAEREELAGRSAQALAGYGRSLAKNPGDAGVRRRALALYERLHGPAGFDEWLQASLDASRTARTQPARKVDRPLPAFSLSDLSGRSWTAQSLAGKTVFLNVWATWCGPCRGELPYVQKLHERTKGAADLLVLTVNIDENPGLVAPFMAKEKFDFPVLMSDIGGMGKWSPVGIPMSYVVDRRGTIVREEAGFLGADGWVDRTEGELRETAARP